MILEMLLKYHKYYFSKNQTIFYFYHPISHLKNLNFVLHPFFENKKFKIVGYNSCL